MDFLSFRRRKHIFFPVEEMNKPDSHSGLFCLLDHITILSCVKSLKSSRIQCLVWCVENGDSAFHSHESWCVAVECALIAIKKKKKNVIIFGAHTSTGVP